MKSVLTTVRCKYDVAVTQECYLGGCFFFFFFYTILCKLSRMLCVKITGDQQFLGYSNHTVSERHLLIATSSMIRHNVTKQKLVSNWFHEHDNEFNVLQWPSQSRDLNPIEHLWDVVEWKICSMNVPLTNLQKLHDAIMSTRNRI